MSKVHKQPFVNCAWTGESLPKEKRYRIPDASCTRWTSSFSSPGCAIAYLDGLKATIGEEKHKACISALQDSLKRTTEMPDSDLSDLRAAPSYELLNTFGGSLSLEEFHASYNHDLQVKLVQQECQKLQERLPTRHARLWFARQYTQSHRVKTKDNIPEMVLVPKNFNGWKKFLLEYAEKGSVVVTFDPEREHVFGLWKPSSYDFPPKKINHNASVDCRNIMLGPATVMSKRLFVSKGNRKAAKTLFGTPPPRKRSLDSDEETVVLEQHEQPALKRTRSECVLSEKEKLSPIRVTRGRKQ